MIYIYIYYLYIHRGFHNKKMKKSRSFRYGLPDNFLCKGQKITGRGVQNPSFMLERARFCFLSQFSPLSRFFLPDSFVVSLSNHNFAHMDRKTYFNIFCLYFKVTSILSIFINLQEQNEYQKNHQNASKEYFEQNFRILIINLLMSNTIRLQFTYSVSKPHVTVDTDRENLNAKEGQPVYPYSSHIIY